ncbi:MAG: hypothetical protein IJ306_06305 [Oscillospiraceae bacterium]|nr:hypothetical protein [Oscillospiraceae bacterium]
MLKNTKVLYGIISVLLVICILCGIHIVKNYSLLLETREHLLNSFAVNASELYSWTEEILDPDTDEAAFVTAIARIKYCLDKMAERSEYLCPPYSVYNVLFFEEKYQYYIVADWFSGYYTDIVLMERRYEENGKLSEEDMLWIETLHTATEELLDELLGENIDDEYILNVKNEYIKKDDLFSILCYNFNEKMEEVAIR